MASWLVENVRGDMRIDGSVATVTRAGSSIGDAPAQSFAAAGEGVVVGMPAPTPISVLGGMATGIHRFGKDRISLSIRALNQSGQSVC
jgi:hypothetical protein